MSLWCILTPGEIRAAAWLDHRSRRPLRSSDDPTFGALIMATITVTPPPSESPWLPYKLSVDQYEAMVESGIFTEHDRLQLIDGLLVAKVTQGDDHCVADELCRMSLSALLPPGWSIRTNKPVRLLTTRSEPEPDEAVVRGSIRDYARGKRGKPGPQEVGLIVEVSASSLADDRAMIRIYGPAGLPIYWIVNLVERQIEVYSDPQPDGYATRTVYRPGDYVPFVLDRTIVGQIAVDDILP